MALGGGWPNKGAVRWFGWLAWTARTYNPVLGCNDNFVHRHAEFVLQFVCVAALRWLFICERDEICVCSVC